MHYQQQLPISHNFHQIFTMGWLKIAIRYRQNNTTRDIVVVSTVQLYFCCCWWCCWKCFIVHRWMTRLNVAFFHNFTMYISKSNNKKDSHNVTKKKRRSTNGTTYKCIFKIILPEKYLIFFPPYEESDSLHKCDGVFVFFRVHAFNLFIWYLFRFSVQSHHRAASVLANKSVSSAKLAFCIYGIHGGMVWRKCERKRECVQMW